MLLVIKFIDRISLVHFEYVWASLGVPVQRQTQERWMIGAAGVLLRNLIRDALLEGAACS